MWYCPAGSAGKWQRPVKVVWQRSSDCAGDCRVMRAELTATPFSSTTEIAGVGADCAAAVLTRTSVRRRARMRLQGYFTVGCGRAAAVCQLEPEGSRYEAYFGKGELGEESGRAMPQIALKV